MFLRLDCVSAYYQVPLSQESQDKVSFIVDTETGVQRLRYRVSPMGHTSSGDVWVRETDQIFMDESTQAWLQKQMDNLLLEAVGDEEQVVDEMAKKLRIIAQKAKESNIVFSITKMECATETTFSGFN